MSEVERITRAIMSARKAQPAVPMRAYQTEAAILAHAIEALSGHGKAVEIEARRCTVGAADLYEITSSNKHPDLMRP